MNSDSKEAKCGMLQIAGATVAFALWHSLLCSLPVKKQLTPVLKTLSVSYRLFFMIQSAFTFGALLWLVFTRPARTIYQLSGILKAFCWFIQAACALICGLSVISISPMRFLLGRGKVEPEAQGPNLDGDGQIEVTGPFRWSRHPLEWAPILLLVFTPHLKTNWLAFNILGAIYAVLGACHEEKRLQASGGKSYKNYQQQVSFWFGRFNRNP